MGEDDLHAVVDGQLAADRHREVMAYLAVYPDAADRVAAFFRQRVELAALRESLSDGEPTREVANLEAALCHSLRRGRRARRRALGGAGLMAVLLAALTGWWLATPDRDRALIAEVSATGRVQPRAFEQQPLAETGPISTEAGDAAVLWLQAHLGGRPLKQPDLEALGLRFVGGSALKGAPGPAIRLVYTDEAEAAFALYVGVKHSGVSLAASMVPEGHISLSWQNGPLSFTLIAPEGSPRLGEIMRSASTLLDPAPVAADAALGTHAAGDAAETLDEAMPADTTGAAPLDPDGTTTGEVSKAL